MEQALLVQGAAAAEEEAEEEVVEEEMARQPAVASMRLRWSLCSSSKELHCQQHMSTELVPELEVRLVALAASKRLHWSQDSSSKALGSHQPRKSMAVCSTTPFCEALFTRKSRSSE